MLLVGGGGGSEAGGLQVIAFSGVPSLSSALVPCGIVTGTFIIGRTDGYDGRCNSAGGRRPGGFSGGADDGRRCRRSRRWCRRVAAVVVAGGGGTAGVVKVLSVETASPTALFEFHPVVISRA